MTFSGGTGSCSGLLLVVAEMATAGGFYIIFFGIGAIVVGVLASFDLAGPIWMQLLLFSVISVGVAAALPRPAAEVAAGRSAGAAGRRARRRGRRSRPKICRPAASAASSCAARPGRRATTTGAPLSRGRALPRDARRRPDALRRARRSPFMSLSGGTIVVFRPRRSSSSSSSRRRRSSCRSRARSSSSGSAGSPACCRPASTSWCRSSTSSATGTR